MLRKMKSEEVWCSCGTIGIHGRENPVRVIARSASDAAIRTPLCAVWDREKENGFPRRADALLGMTGSEVGASFYTRHIIPHRADTQVGPYPVKWVRRTGRGEPAPAKRHGKFPISNF